MKFYRLDYDEPGGDGWRVAWAGSLHDAAKQRAEIQRTCGHDTQIRTTLAEIPTSHAALLAWLRAHVTADGG